VAAGYLTGVEQRRRHAGSFAREGDYERGCLSEVRA
jgi:hypothetical protein